MNLLEGKKAIVFFPYLPFPAQSGAQLRCISMLEALSSAGLKVTFMTICTPNALRSVVKNFSDLGIDEIIDLPPKSKWDILPFIIRNKIFRVNTFENYQLDFLGAAGRRKLKRVIKGRLFDFSIVNYSQWRCIQAAIPATKKILEIHDIGSINISITSHVKKLIRIDNKKINNISPLFLSLECYSKINLKPSDKEIQAFKGFDLAISISRKEAEILSERLKDSEIKIIYPSAKEVTVVPDYLGSPMFASSPNIFNLQGILHFQKKILPEILSRISNFVLKVSGNVYSDCSIPSSGEIQMLGLLPDVCDLYASSAFAIIPTFGGTGQQMKIVEAMSYGLPVVAYSQRVEAEVVRNGVTGYLVNNEIEFAERVIELWNDRGLCRSMGFAAREHVTSELSQKIVNKKIGSMLRNIL